MGTYNVADTKPPQSHTLSMACVIHNDNSTSLLYKPETSFSLC